MDLCSWRASGAGDGTPENCGADAETILNTRTRFRGAGQIRANSDLAIGCGAAAKISCGNNRTLLVILGTLLPTRLQPKHNVLRNITNLIRNDVVALTGIHLSRFLGCRIIDISHDIQLT